MKIQFAAVLKDRQGVDFSEPDPARSSNTQVVMRPVTLGIICCAVLDQVLQEEATEGLKPKLRRAELIDRITAAEGKIEPLELLDADREMLKERIAKRNFPTMLTVAAVRLLDVDAHAEAAT